MSDPVFGSKDERTVFHLACVPYEFVSFAERCGMSVLRAIEIFTYKRTRLQRLICVTGALEIAGDVADRE